jgi:hypothetical protein
MAATARIEINSSSSIRARCFSSCLGDMEDMHLALMA